jgi:hypothetical protein
MQMIETNCAIARDPTPFANHALGRSHRQLRVGRSRRASSQLLRFCRSKRDIIFDRLINTAPAIYLAIHYYLAILSFDAADLSHFSIARYSRMRCDACGQDLRFLIRSHTGPLVRLVMASRTNMSARHCVMLIGVGRSDWSPVDLSMCWADLIEARGGPYVNA